MLHYVQACFSPFQATGRHFIIVHVPTVCLSVLDIRLFFSDQRVRTVGTGNCEKVQIDKGYRY
jgi:hypothetical protein